MQPAFTLLKNLAKVAHFVVFVWCRVYLLEERLWHPIFTVQAGGSPTE